MTTKGPKELLDFLGLVDRELTSSGEIVVIGGAAIALAYRGTNYLTADIDMIRTTGEDLERAFAAAAKKSPKPIPYSHVGVAVAPPTYEQRLLRIHPRGSSASTGGS